MPLTPLDIHNKEFKRSFRGYDEEEVDEFLDQVLENYEALYKENMSLKETVATKDSNITRYKDLEDTLKQTLVVAQHTADEIKTNSEKQAAVVLKEAELKSLQIIGEAEEKARQTIHDAEEYAQRLYRETEELRKQVQLFKVKFKSFLEGQLALIGEEGEIFGDLNLINKFNVKADLEVAASARGEEDESQEPRQIINKEVIL